MIGHGHAISSTQRLFMSLSGHAQRRAKPKGHSQRIRPSSSCASDVIRANSFSRTPGGKPMPARRQAAVSLSPFASNSQITCTRSGVTIGLRPSKAWIVTKRRPRRPPMLNSARWHCTSPRRGRRVECLHFRARLFCRRCACDASYESMGNAGRIGVTTADKPLVIDSGKRCKG